MMTVVNKFVVSGHQFTMTFLRMFPCLRLGGEELTRQYSRLNRSFVLHVSTVSSELVSSAVSFLISRPIQADRSVRDFDLNDAKAWFPVSFLLVAVIYTGSKSLVS